MKYLVVLLVVGLGLWMLLARARGNRPKAPPPRQSPAAKAMMACAHCGLHLPAAEAVMLGEQAFCSEAHRKLGPREAGHR